MPEPEIGSTILVAMLITHVHVHVKPDSIEAFKQATVANARESVKEAGVARFDVIQSADDPARFILVEVYRTKEAPAEHKTPPTTRPGGPLSRR